MLFLLLYLGGALASWYLCAGMMFRSVQRDGTAEWAREALRSDLGMSILVGGLFALIWPLGLPAAWLLSGFAEHGVWVARRKP